MNSSNEHISMAERMDRLEDLAYDLNESVLKQLKIQEENIRRLILVSSKLSDLDPVVYYTKQLGHNLVASQKCERYIILHKEKRKFQRRLQKKHGDSKFVFDREYNPYVDPPRINFEIIPKHVEEQTSLVLSHDDIQEPKGDIAPKQEELDLYANVVPIYDEYPESDCEEFVETFEEMVEAPCEEIVETREEVVEIPCMESHEDFEEVVETVGMENVGSTMECFEKVDSHPRLEVGLQGEQTRKHEFAKVYFVEYVHDSTFVEFNPTKIRGRIFSKKGRMIQVHGVMGNTSKLIFLVSLFNIWVWLIMQVRTRAFMLTCVFTRNSPANGNRTVCVCTVQQVHQHLC